MNARLFSFACCLLLMFAVLPAEAAEVKAESFTLQVPEGWRVVSSPESGVVAVMPSARGFTMTLHVGETGGQSAVDMARQGSRAQNGSDPIQMEGLKSEAYVYNWVAPKGELTSTMLFVNKGKALTVNTIGTIDPYADAAEAILKSVVSSDPAVNEILEDWRE